MELYSLSSLPNKRASVLLYDRAIMIKNITLCKHQKVSSLVLEYPARNNHSHSLSQQFFARLFHQLNAWNKLWLLLEWFYPWRLKIKSFNDAFKWNLSVILSSDAVYYMIQSGSNFWSLKCDHVNENLWVNVVLSCDAVYYAVKSDFNFWVNGRSFKVLPFKWKLLSYTFLWYCSFAVKVSK